MTDSAETLMRPWLDLWHELLGDPTIPRFSEPDDMVGVLADLRRDPQRLKQAFAPLPRGQELLRRVRRCIDAEADHGGVYLVPMSQQTSDAELLGLTREALERGCACCKLDVPDYRIEIQRCELPPEARTSSAPLVEELGDLFIAEKYDRAGVEPAAMQFLSEALYTLAASFEVRGYVLTPLCSERIRTIEPYEPQIELWLKGARAVIRWNDDETWVCVYAP